MAVGRHLGERGHVVEKEQNYYTGDTEEREDFINIEEGKSNEWFWPYRNIFLINYFVEPEEAHQFNEEWKSRARSHQGLHGPARIEMSRPHQSSSSSYLGAPLAITAGPSTDGDRQRSRHSTHPRGYFDYRIKYRR